MQCKSEHKVRACVSFHQCMLTSEYWLVPLKYLTPRDQGFQMLGNLNAATNMDQFHNLLMQSTLYSLPITKQVVQ